MDMRRQKLTLVTNGNVFAWKECTRNLGIAHIANYELLPHADQGSERNGSHQSHLSPFCAAAIFRCYCCPLRVQRMQPHTLAHKACSHATIKHRDFIYVLLSLARGFLFLSLL